MAFKFTLPYSKKVIEWDFIKQGQRMALMKLSDETEMAVKTLLYSLRSVNGVAFDILKHAAEFDELPAIDVDAFADEVKRVTADIRNPASPLEVK